MLSDLSLATKSSHSRVMVEGQKKVEWPMLESDPAGYWKLTLMMTMMMSNKHVILLLIMSLDYLTHVICNILFAKLQFFLLAVSAYNILLYVKFIELSIYKENKQKHTHIHTES